MKELSSLVHERLAKTFNAAIGVLETSKNGGYALISTLVNYCSFLAARCRDFITEHN